MKNLISLKTIVVLIGIILFLVSCFIIIKVTNKNEYVFYLKGENHVVLNVGEKYQESGFIAVDSHNRDLSNYVKVESFINSNQLGNYIIKYTLKKDNYVKELIRMVSIGNLNNDDYYLVLNGDTNIEILKDNNYEELGCYFYDSKTNLIDVDVNISGDVDVNSVGMYTLTYTVEYDNKQYKTSRSVEVYDWNYEYMKTNESNGVKYTFYIDSEYYSYSKLPDNSIVKENIFTFLCEDNDVYYFEFFDINGNSKKESITVNSIVNDISCTGIVNRYGTELSLVGKDKDKFNTFEWYFEGIKKNSNLLSYKKSTSAYVIAKNDNKKIKVDCDIKNNLVYNFEYNFDNLKPLMNCNTYTTGDRIELEWKLKSVILDAGYGTRAGIVEAARFIVGALQYRIPYLGPKTVNSILGRYEKEGLNIGNDQGWGCGIDGYTQGIDCTNFIAWIFKQNGLKVDGVYSHKNVYKLNSIIYKVRPGDLILKDKDDSFSHVGLIVGVDDDYIYVAESSGSKGVILTRIKKTEASKEKRFSHARLYEYQNEGNLTNMWVN